MYDLAWDEMNDGGLCIGRGIIAWVCGIGKWFKAEMAWHGMAYGRHYEMHCMKESDAGGRFRRNVLPA